MRKIKTDQTGKSADCLYYGLNLKICEHKSKESKETFFYFTEQNLYRVSTEINKARK